MVKDRTTSFQDRLTMSGLTTLETWRLYVDLSELS